MRTNTEILLDKAMDILTVRELPLTATLLSTVTTLLGEEGYEPTEAPKVIERPSLEREAADRHKWEDDWVKHVADKLNSGVTIEQLSQESKTGFTEEAIRAKLYRAGYTFSNGKPVKKVA